MSSLAQSKGFWIALTVAVIMAISAIFVWRAFASPQDSAFSASDLPNSQESSFGSVALSSSSKAPSATVSGKAPSNGGTSSGSTTGNEDFGACTEDAKVYCSGFYGSDWETWATANGYTTASWKLGLVDCLEQNRDKTSEACHDSMDRRAGLNDDVNTLCAADRAQYCPGVEPKPGSEPQVDCLKENYASLSAECAAAVDAHEAAKPTDQQD